MDYVKTEITEDDIGSIVILDNKHEVILISVGKVFAKVKSNSIWSVMKNRLKRCLTATKIIHL